ncbi:MAG: ATP phosphoribosyltransferase [Actinobacteria bacterium]|nr:ATP phosphoribosyltransferase [Actinomycetota bacterium]
MEKELKIAIPKGYLFGECKDMLERAGYDTAPLGDNDRKLVVYSQVDSIKYIISRPMDVPVYVEHGACDIGFAGKDVLLEKESKVYELLDLKNGRCRLVLATKKDETQKVKKHYQHFGSVRVATSYPNIARKYFDSKGMQVEIIKLHGSVELAPVLGMAEEILDITSTGKTIRDNDLVEMESIMISTNRLIANIASYKIKYGQISRLIDNIRKTL